MRMKQRLFYLLFFLLGLATLCFGVYMRFFENNGYVKTTAIITQIDETYTGTDSDGHSEYDYDVYVDYTVDGKEYHGKSDLYQSNYEEGKEITIYYNPENPEEIHGDGKTFGLYLMIAGPVVMIIMAIMFFRS